MSMTIRAVLDTLGVSPGNTPDMRVIECNECGETISAANDEELTRHLAAHLRSEHGEELDEDEVADLVHEQAYDATDS
jgi:predicted small metal-binding protein